MQACASYIVLIIMTILSSDPERELEQDIEAGYHQYVPAVVAYIQPSHGDFQYRQQSEADSKTYLKDNEDRG